MIGLNAFLFGEYAVGCGFVQMSELKKAIGLQESHKLNGTSLLLGEVLRDLNFISNSACNHIARLQEHQRKGIEGYELIRYLGKGGIGSVFVARQISLDREVALKVVKVSANKQTVDEAYKEARTIAGFTHPNIVAAFDVGFKDGVIYLAMELIEGPDLKQIFKEQGLLSEDDCLEVGAKICDALHYLHTQHCVHRDIKPGNILIDKDNQIKLIDLGLALNIASGEKGAKSKKGVGTPNYISPEQAMGRLDIDIRSDIYSLGATLYYLATGGYVFQGTNSREVLLKHVKEEPIPPKEKNPALSDAFSDLLMQMLKKAPSDRPMADEAATQFQKIINGEIPKDPKASGLKHRKTSKEGSTAGRKRGARRRRRR